MLFSTHAAKMWMPSSQELIRLGPLWVLVGTILAILIASLIFGRQWRITGVIAALGALVAAVLCLRGFSAEAGCWAGLTPATDAPMLVVDPFSTFFIFLLSLFLVLITGMWFMGLSTGLPERLARRQDATEFFVLLIGSAFGMALMVSTTNLLMIVLAVETASLPSYGLAGFRKRHRLAAEASLKYILFGAVTSAIMIYGASLLYGQYHTLDLAQIGGRMAAQTAAGGPTVLMGVSLCAFMVGVAFKVSAVPFHFWCPDVFEGASIEVTTWLSVASKAAGLGLLLRIMAVLTTAEGMAHPQVVLAYVSTTIAVVAAVTCTVGNLAAYWQTNLKRLLAFSSIAHAGYMLMAVAIIWRPDGGATSLAHPAFSAVVAYISIYMLMNLGAFGVVAMVYWDTGKETLDAFNGLSRRSPLLAVAMAVFLFSLVGLPPLGGFIAKWWLLVPLFEAGLVWLVVVAVINTLLSLYYYARVMYAMCFVDDAQPAVRAPALGRFVVTCCAVGIILAGTVWAGNLKAFSDARSRNLYAVVKQAPLASMAERNE